MFSAVYTPNKCAPREAYSIVGSVVYLLPWQPLLNVTFIYAYIAPVDYFTIAVYFLPYQVQKNVVLDASFRYTVADMETLQPNGGHVGFSSLL